MVLWWWVVLENDSVGKWLWRMAAMLVDDVDSGGEYW